MTPVKVTVTITVTVDPEAWDEQYGTGTTAALVKADVKRYVANSVANLEAIDATSARVVSR